MEIHGTEGSTFSLFVCVFDCFPSNAEVNKRELIRSWTVRQSIAHVADEKAFNQEMHTEYAKLQVRDVFWIGKNS
jgi:hypothetical protein